MRFILMLVAAASLAGCVLPPRDAPHPRQLQSDRLGLTGQFVERAPEGWWNSFQDPQLDRLIRAGLQDSPTLAQAQARLAEAVAQTIPPDRRCCRTRTWMRAPCINGLRRTI